MAKFHSNLADSLIARAKNARLAAQLGRGDGTEAAAIHCERRKPTSFYVSNHSAVR